MGCAPRGTAHPARLVVVIVMDMLPAGTLQRIRPSLHGGFARLLDEGRDFVRCEHRQSATLTGPSHTTLFSGLHPRHHGIILNDWYDRESDEEVYCAGDPTLPTGVSAAHLRGENLADALKRSHPDAKVFAVSGKDRSAVLPAGHRPDGAFWFDRDTGGFKGNMPNGGPPPAWGEAYWGGLELGAEPYRLDIPGWWTYPVRPEGAEDDRPSEQPRYSRVAPHPLMDGDDSGHGKVADRIYHSPWLNRLILELAGRLVEEESLGRDGAPDLLIVGLSAGDPVGHYYGPASQEYLDVLLRTDEWLGEFMRRVDELAGSPSGGVIYALSADHGVLPLPETIEGGRRIDRANLERGLEETLATRLGGKEEHYIAHLVTGHVYFDRRALGRAGVTVSEAARIAAQEWTRLDGVERVYTSEELRAPAAPGEEGDLFLELYRNAYDPERGGDVVLQPCRLCLITSGRVETSHGSPYEYDRDVPLILMGEGIEPGEDTAACRTVDLAPTLAGWLGAAFDAPRDGRPLLGLVDKAGAVP